MDPSDPSDTSAGDSSSRVQAETYGTMENHQTDVHKARYQLLEDAGMTAPTDSSESLENQAAPTQNTDHSAVNGFMVSIGFKWDDGPDWWYNEYITLYQKAAANLYEQVAQREAEIDRLARIDEQQRITWWPNEAVFIERQADRIAELTAQKNKDGLT